MGGRLSVSLRCWSRCLEAVGNWLFQSGAVSFMWAQGCPALFWTQYWKFMTDPAREPFKNKSLWEPVHPMSRDLNNRKIRKDIFISLVSSQPSPVGFPQPSVPVWFFSRHIRVLQNERCLPISSMVGLICIYKILLASVMKIQYDVGLNSAFRSYSPPPLIVSEHWWGSVYTNMVKFPSSDNSYFLPFCFMPELNLISSSDSWSF